MRTFPLSSLSWWLCPISFLCFVCAVVTFFFSLRLCLHCFCIPSLGSLAGKGSSERRRYISDVMNAQVKFGDINYRRNVFTVKRLQLVLIAITASCHLETVGNGLRSVLDNAQEAKSSVNTERDRSRGV